MMKKNRQSSDSSASSSLFVTRPFHRFQLNLTLSRQVVYLLARDHGTQPEMTKSTKAAAGLITAVTAEARPVSDSSRINRQGSRKRLLGTGKGSGRGVTESQLHDSTSGEELWAAEDGVGWARWQTLRFRLDLDLFFTVIVPPALMALSLVFFFRAWAASSSPPGGARMPAPTVALGSDPDIASSGTFADSENEHFCANGAGWVGLAFDGIAAVFRRQARLAWWAGNELLKCTEAIGTWADTAIAAAQDQGAALAWMIRPAGVLIRCWDFGPAERAVYATLSVLTFCKILYLVMGLETYGSFVLILIHVTRKDLPIFLVIYTVPTASSTLPTRDKESGFESSSVKRAQGS